MKKLMAVVFLSLLFCSVSFGAIQKIGIVTDAHVGGSNTGSNYYAEAVAKLATAMAAFDAADVDVLVSLGDWVNTPDDIDVGAGDDLAELQAVWTDTTTYSNLSDAEWLYCVGNHDFDVDDSKTQYTTAIGQISNGNFNAGNAAASYGYYVVGNVRIFILDTNFDSTGNDSSLQAGYISPTQLAWLDAQLTIADAAGNYSICLHHHCILSEEQASASQYIANEAAYFNILKRHKVIATASGHVHAQVHSSVHKVRNSEGTRIVNKQTLPLIYCSAADAAIANYTIFYVDDQTGAWYFSPGAGWEYGLRQMRFTGEYSANRNNINETTNYDYYAAGGTWQENNVSLDDGDFVISYDDTYAHASTGSFLEDGSVGGGLMGLTAIIVKANWTKPLGAASPYGVLSRFCGLLEINGGFAGNNLGSNDLTWFMSKGGYALIEVTGTGGNGGKHILIGNSSSPTADTYHHEVYMDPGDDTYEIEFTDTASEMSIKSLELLSGIVTLTDIHGVDSETDLQACTIYGGELRLARDAADEPVNVAAIVMYGGTLDMTTGTNAANGKTVDKLTVRGPVTVDLDVDGLVFTNGIDFYKQPASWDFHAETLHSMTFYYRLITLTDAGDGITIGAVPSSKNAAYEGITNEAYGGGNTIYEE